MYPLKDCHKILFSFYMFGQQCITIHRQLQLYRIKKYLQEKMADFVYNGFWFSPEAFFTRKCLEMSQETVTGTVTLQIFKGNGKFLVQKLNSDRQL